MVVTFGTRVKVAQIIGSVQLRYKVGQGSRQIFPINGPKKRMIFALNGPIGAQLLDRIVCQQAEY